MVHLLHVVYVLGIRLPEFRVPTHLSGFLLLFRRFTWLQCFPMVGITSWGHGCVPLVVAHCPLLLDLFQFQDSHLSAKIVDP